VSLNVTEGGSISLSGSLKNPLMWSAEEPNLYILVISLYANLKDAEKGVNVVDMESCRVGIRDVGLSAENNVLSVSGKPLVIAGVNRHEFDPTHGRSVSIETMRKDAMIMKQLNFNSTRCSHYPQHRYVCLYIYKYIYIYIYIHLFI
jgi:beta-galactosidase